MQLVQGEEASSQPDPTHIVDYYRAQAVEHGSSPSSTMLDEIVRDKEIEAILLFLDRVSGRNLLEIGCGNGFLLEEIANRFGTRFAQHGLDLTRDMLTVARHRPIDCNWYLADVQKLPFASNTFDVIVSERVVINILDPEGQMRAFDEIARVLKPQGVVVAIEGFKTGLQNLNRARAEFLLPAIPEPDVNNWFTEQRWQSFLSNRFREFDSKEAAGLAPENFLSSHYFMTRFVHDAIKPEGGKLRNTEFAKFFSAALPPAGDYSPLRIKYLRKK
ncbi:MAG: class I SAM-dependent methyltransferase [Acidobacteriaceae bacterium]|nr:class I SAM-dependent methyltransferase [Acidobacteriaceae bacterium]